MKPSVKSVRVSVAAAALASLAAAGCGTTAGGTPPNPAPGGQAGFTVVLLAVSAISALDSGVRATATVTGDQLTVTIGGYALIARRDGRQANSPTVIPTGASSSVAR